MLDPKEWNDLLTFLVTSLTEKRANDAAEEVRIAASSRIVEEELTGPKVDVLGEDEFSLKDRVRTYRGVEQTTEGVGSTSVRAPSPKEACLAAIEVLRTRLTEPPRMSERMSSLLERKPEEIEWRLEDFEGLAPTGISDFSCSELTLNVDDSAVITHALNTLLDLVKEV